MKTTIFTTSLVLLLSTMTFATNNDRPHFDKKKDLLIAQFDSKPDPDDIHAQAALGSMMLHPDLKGVKVYAVSGAIGEQKGKFLDSENLLNMAFGKRWTAANEDWEAAVKDIVKQVIPILKKGGKVWVQEAGQSNITADWVSEITKNIAPKIIKTNVIVVQHSHWNENETNDADLAYIQETTNYFSIDDGNMPADDTKSDRGPHTTPQYRDPNKKWIAQAKSSSNKKANKLWNEADRIIDYNFPNGFNHKWSYLYSDGVDYSDCVENWWILEIGEKADTHQKFWERYVTN